MISANIGHDCRGNVQDDSRRDNRSHHAECPEHPFAVLVDLQAFDLEPGDDKRYENKDRKGASCSLGIDMSGIGVRGDDDATSRAEGVQEEDYVAVDAMKNEEFLAVISMS